MNETRQTTGSLKAWSLEILRRVLVTIVIALPVSYVGDYVSLRFGLPPRDPYDVVKVEQYYTVPRKDGRLEYYSDDPIDQKCVRSLFPHMGLNPCWYVRRGREKPTNL